MHVKKLLAPQKREFFRRRKHFRILFLVAMVGSIMLYAPTVLLSQKAAGEFGLRLKSLKVCSAFRLLADKAVLVVAGRIPVDIQVDETSALYDGKRMTT